jgi:hypothetical protein
LKFDEYITLDRTISTNVLGPVCNDRASGSCHVYTVEQDGYGIIGSSLKSTWCANRIIPSGKPACVVQIIPRPNFAPANKKGSKDPELNGDVLIEIVYYDDPSVRVH